jgi:hypothetical protein
MKIKNIRKVEYEYGQEKRIIKLLNKSKEPILIKIKDFTPQFDLDYFMAHVGGLTTYDTYEHSKKTAHESGEFLQVLSEIKQNMPHRIFGQIVSQEINNAVEYHVPLWRKMPQRPRFFNKFINIVYFFGGKGSHTEMHFDREHCCILHLCLCGQKKFLLFTESQNDHLYKTPFVGDTLIDFGLPKEQLDKAFPKLQNAEGYEVILERGDMLFMPRNCWHFTTYLDASAAASYVFYPKKFFQFYGYITGYFYMALLEKNRGGVGLYALPIFTKFRIAYALAEGRKKFWYKIMERILFCILLPTLCIYTKVSFLLKPRRVY